MPLWDKKSKELADDLANAQAEAMYRNAIMASNPPTVTIGGLQSGSISNGLSSVDLARRVSGTYPSRPGFSDITSPESRKAMLAMRLRLTDGMRWPFDFLETHLQEEQVLVFLVVKGKPVILEDEAGLFPSDTLVTQLRLIQE